MKNKLQSISTKRFSYQADTRTMVAEKSDLGGFNIFQKLFDDAVDAGFAMESHKTGNEIVFMFVDEKRDGTFDDEIQAWNFIMVRPTAHGYVEHDMGIKAIIFND